LKFKEGDLGAYYFAFSFAGIEEIDLERVGGLNSPALI